MWTGDTVSVTGLAEPEEVRAIDVTDGMLPMLGATPALGRLFTKHDDSPGAADDGDPDRRATGERASARIRR